MLGAGGRGAGERVLEDGARRPPSYLESASVLETINSRNNISLNCYKRYDISLNDYKRNDISLNDYKRNDISLNCYKRDDIS